MKIVACIIARTNSQRLKRKVLKTVAGKSMIEHIIGNVKTVSGIDEIYICTSKNKDDQILLEIANQNNIKAYAGSELSVIDRMIDVGKIEEATHLIRITADNIFTDSIYLQLMIDILRKDETIDYLRSEYLPIGVTAEVINFIALQFLYNNMTPEESEYLLWYIFNPKKYKCAVVIPKDFFVKPYYNLSVDTEEDWIRTKYIFSNANGPIKLKSILELDNIPYLRLDPDTSVKLPNTAITFKEFREEMDKRIAASIKVYE